MHSPSTPYPLTNDSSEDVFENYISILLPPEVAQLVLDSSCSPNASLEWGYLRPRPPETEDCIGGLNCTAMVQPPKGASVVFPLLLFLTGIIGQIWALVYLYRTPRPNSRTVFYVMLSTLLWTDLAGKILTTPPAVIAYFNGHWTGGRNLCHYHGYVMSVIGIVTHLLVCAMAIERLLGIRHGYFYNQNVTTYRVKSLLTGLWGFGMVFCSLPLFGLGRLVLQYPGTWCFIDTHLCPDTPLQDSIFTFTYGAINCAALIVMVICNIVVVGTLLSMRVTQAVPFLQSGERLNSIRNKKHSELEIQMVFVLLIITSVFVISWGPLDVIIFANNIWPHKKLSDHWIDFVAIRLVSVNQIVNPWAYVICRLAYRSKLCQCCRQAFIGRRFSLLDEGKRSSIANSLRSIRKMSRAGPRGDSPTSTGKDAGDHSISMGSTYYRRPSTGKSRKESRGSTSPVYPKPPIHRGSSGGSSINYKPSKPVDGGDAYFHLERETSLKRSPIDATLEEMNHGNSLAFVGKNLEYIDAKSGETPRQGLDTSRLTFNVDDVYGSKEFQPIPLVRESDLDPEVYLSPKKKTDAADTDRERRIGVANLWLHPLGKVMTNRSFLRIKNEGEIFGNHKRTQSLDGAPGQLLLVVPVESRSRSFQTLQQDQLALSIPASKTNVSHSKTSLAPRDLNVSGISPSRSFTGLCVDNPPTFEIGSNLAQQEVSNINLSNCELIFLDDPVVKFDMCQTLPEAQAAPDSAGLTASDEDYFSSYTSNGMFDPVDSDPPTLRDDLRIKDSPTEGEKGESCREKHDGQENGFKIKESANGDSKTLATVPLCSLDAKDNVNGHKPDNDGGGGRADESDGVDVVKTDHLNGNELVLHSDERDKKLNNSNCLNSVDQNGHKQSFTGKCAKNTQETEPLLFSK